jgi:hypothetical protein
MATELGLEDYAQQRIEKLVDWELRKQLSWAAAFFSSIFGLVSLLSSSLLKTGSPLPKDKMGKNNSKTETHNII